MWFGVDEAHRRGAGAYLTARMMFDCCGRWPAIEAYDWRKGTHRGLQLEPPIAFNHDAFTAWAAEARDEARKYPHVADWLNAFALRMETEADLDLGKAAWLCR